MNSFKFVFSLVLVYMTVVAVSANTWISLWVLMEFSFMVLMGILSVESNYSMSEMMMKYYLIQVFAGLGVLVSVLLSFYFSSLVLEILLGVGLFIKLGLAPFHFWVIGLLGKVSWIGAYFMLSFMKLIPITFIVYSLDIISLGVFLWGSICVGSVFGLNNSSIQKLMGYSGLVSISWMLYAAAAGGCIVFFFFFFGYLFMLFTFFFFCSTMGIYYLNQFKLVFFNLLGKVYFFLFCLAFSGIPPFWGFLLKWWVSWFLMFSGMSFTVIFLIFMSLISLFFYIQLWFYFMLIYSFENKWYSFVFSSVYWMVVYFFFLFGLSLFFVYM